MILAVVVAATDSRVLPSTGLYQELDMLADPDEPRDLFGMLLRAAVVAKTAPAAL